MYQRLTSHKQHLALFLHRFHILFVVFVYNVDRLFHITEDEVAVAVICLASIISISLECRCREYQMFVHVACP